MKIEVKKKLHSFSYAAEEKFQKIVGIKIKAEVQSKNHKLTLEF